MAGSNINKAILSVLDVVKSFGAQPVLDGVSLTVHEGDRLGLIGVNGSGKSTLLRIIAGVYEPDDGEVTRSQDLRISYLAQVCPLPHDITVGDALNEACEEVRALLKEFHRLTEALAECDADTPEYGELERHHAHLQHELELTDAWNVDQELKRISIALALPPEDRLLGTLSGGELRRVDLAARIIQKPDLLLLDEPTNQIDTGSVEWIENFLASYEGSCILVTHDRYFLDRVVNRIVELDFSRLYSVPGKYSDFLDHKARVQEIEARTETRRQAILRRELAWLRRGPKARGTKQQARVDRAEELLDQDGPKRHKEISFEIPRSRRLGKIVLEAQGIAFQYDDEPLFRHFSLLMQSGMRVGIVGPNGSGKTTLLRVLMGEEQPTEGKLTHGDNTEFLYVDQTHEEVDPDETILNHVSNGAHYWDVNERRIYVPRYLEQFLFDSDSIFMPMGNLSGGERNRIDLARKLLRGGNFLVLDEPTNDLDLNTLRVLEEAIEDFDGCAMIVSHDRYFLNRLCTHMLVFEGDGRVTQIAGNYDDYVRYKAEVAAAKPREIKKGPAKPKAELKERRLSYMEKKELEGMEETIFEAEAEVERLEAAMAAPEFYNQDHTAVREAVEALDVAKSDVEALYARWEELEAIANA